MTNRYEAPEVIEIGKAHDVILGEKGEPILLDSQTGERDVDFVTD